MVSFYRALHSNRFVKVVGLTYTVEDVSLCGPNKGALHFYTLRKLKRHDDIHTPPSRASRSMYYLKKSMCVASWLRESAYSSGQSPALRALPERVYGVIVPPRRNGVRYDVPVHLFSSFLVPPASHLLPSEHGIRRKEGVKRKCRMNMQSKQPPCPAAQKERTNGKETATADVSQRRRHGMHRPNWVEQLIQVSSEVSTAPSVLIRTSSRVEKEFRLLNNFLFSRVQIALPSLLEGGGGGCGSWWSGPPQRITMNIKR
eukprot:gene11582-7978_t